MANCRPMSGAFDDLRICHVNCQSLYAHYDEFADYFSAADFHIICLSETWLRPAISDDMVHLAGYTLYRCDRQGRMGGGVAFYIKNSISAAVLHFSTASDVRKPEYIIAEVIVCNSAKFLLAVVYSRTADICKSSSNSFLTSRCPTDTQSSLVILTRIWP